jgi:hypothetical protein
MKKTLFIALVLAAVAGLAVAGVAYAQGSQPTGGLSAPGAEYGPMISQDQEGPLHEYMLAAMAEALGIPATDLETRLANGETFYQIALAEGIAADDIPALMQTARSQALAAALADGTITQEQANWMQAHAFGHGGYGQGMRLGQGLGAGQGACGGTGVPVGTGMQRGRRWAQQNP